MKNFIARVSPFVHPIPILNEKEGPAREERLERREAGTATMRRSDHDVTDSIRTTDPSAVGAEVVRLFNGLYGKASAQVMQRGFLDAIPACKVITPEPT